MSHPSMVAGHNQGTRMSLLLNPAETVHLNDDATEDPFLSGNDNDDFNFKVDPAESQYRVSASRLYLSVNEMLAICRQIRVEYSFAAGSGINWVRIVRFCPQS